MLIRSKPTYDSKVLLVCLSFPLRPEGGISVLSVNRFLIARAYLPLTFADKHVSWTKDIKYTTTKKLVTKYRNTVSWNIKNATSQTDSHLGWTHFHCPRKLPDRQRH